MSNGSRTRPFGEDEARPTLENRQVDITPEIEHVTYSDGGYEVTYLAPGKNFDFRLPAITPLATEAEMTRNGFARGLLPIALINLANYPVMLLDRGSNAFSRGPEPLVALPEGKPNTTIDTRFLLIGKEAIAQVGIRAGAQTRGDNISAIHGFNPGEAVILGRDYDDLFQSKFTDFVSAKHISFSASKDGELVRTIDLQSSNGTQVELRRPENA